MRLPILIVSLVSLLNLPAVLAQSGTVIPSIPGFELRLLDKRVPLEVMVGGHVEKHDISVWLHMPKKGQTPGVGLDEITEPTDLSGGTTVLAPPPNGFALRAMKDPYRETITLSTGQVAVIETPVFIYYPTQVSAVRIGTVDPSASESGARAVLKQVPTVAESTKASMDVITELKRLREQFAGTLSILPDGGAKERVRELTAHLAVIINRYEASNYAYDTNGTLVTNASL